MSKSTKAEPAGAAYQRYALGVMTAVFTLTLVDRGLMILLLEPIKRDLGLSDTQLGFVTGIAFGLFYAVMGLPIARWADRGNRVTIAALAMAAWGTTVMACVFVGNYAQLVAARVLAAVGEAGGKPPTYSLIGDYFPTPAARTKAMGVYWLGSPIASLISLIVGGWLNERIGWRATFLVMGIPGLLLAVLVKTTLRDPRTTIVVETTAQTAQPPVRAVIATLWRSRSFRHLSAGLILFYAIGYGMSPWYGAFLIRSHGMSTSDLGVWLGLIFGVSGAIGILAGGYIASKWFVDNERGQTTLTALMFVILVPCFTAFLMLPGKYEALAALALLQVVFSFFYAPTYALMQRLVGDECRATALSVVMLLANLIGMGIGPQLVGVTSDLLMPALGAESLRWAMLVLSGASLWAAFHFWQAGRTVREDLESVANPNPALGAGE